MLQFGNQPMVSHDLSIAYLSLFSSNFDQWSCVRRRRRQDGINELSSCVFLTGTLKLRNKSVSYFGTKLWQEKKSPAIYIILPVHESCIGQRCSTELSTVPSSNPILRRRSHGNRYGRRCYDDEARDHVTWEQLQQRNVVWCCRWVLAENPGQM